MGYAIVHMQKFKAGGVRGIQSHNNREYPPKTNPDIDATKTRDNYHLQQCQNYSQAIKRTIAEQASHTKTVRKDAVVYCSFIVTSDHDTMSAMDPERQRAFFQDSLRFFADRYGHENIINATVHMDERTPHMHLGLVPVKENRLSAKNLFTRQELGQVQTDFVAAVGSKFGLERGREGSEREHLSERQFKLETAKKANQELQIKNMAIRQAIDQQRADLEGMRLEYKEEHDRTLAAVKRYHELLDEIPAAEHQLTEAQNAVLSLENKKNALSLEIGQKIAEIENLAATKANLERDIGRARENLTKLRSVLERMAADIENIPAFLAEYKDKLCQQTRKILRDIAEKQEVSSSGNRAKTASTNKAAFDSRQPNFQEFVKQQQEKQDIQERFTKLFNLDEQELKPAHKKSKGLSR